MPVTWVMLERRDVAAQARSYLTAYVTGEWGAPCQPYLPGLDEREISVVKRRLLRQNAEWAAWLYQRRIPYARLFYEDVVDAPTVAVAAVRAQLRRGRERSAEAVSFSPCRP